MAKTYEDLKEFIGSEDLDQDAIIEDCFNEAVVLVAKYVGTAIVPELIQDKAVLMVGADLWQRRSAPNGLVSQQFATADGIGVSALRLPSDPLGVVIGLLRPWVMPF